jgi:agmatinase
MTFGKAAPVRLTDKWKADVGVLGIPYDAGASYLPGARFGPRAIREGSQRLGFFDPDLGVPGLLRP